MRTTLALFAAALGISVLAACDRSPATPSDLDPADLAETVIVARTQFTSGTTHFWRDFMPVVSAPGPDGGRPLQGVVELTARNHGEAGRQFAATVSVCDAAGTRHPMPIVRVWLLDGPAWSMWDGRIAPGTSASLRLELKGGPYLTVGSSAIAVITWTEEGGASGALRTAATAVARTD